MKIPFDQRICDWCGNTKTYINKRGVPEWRNIDDKPWCLRCYDRIFSHPTRNPKRTKEQLRKSNEKRIKFKDKIMYLSENPRIGVCNGCRAVVPFDCPKTDMHHEEYDELDILKNTIELCTNCHNNETIQQLLSDNAFSNFIR